MLRKLSTLIAVVVIGAVAGMIGQSLIANAGAPNVTPRSDKTIYAKANPAFTENVTQTPGTAKTLLKITVHAPAAGQVDVVVNSQLWTDFPSTTTNELENTLVVGRCSVANTVSTTQCANNTRYWFHKPQNQGPNDSTYPYSIQSQLNFSTGGSRTLYLNANSSQYPAGLWGQATAHVQVAFTPKHPISTTAKVTVTAKTPGSL